MISTIIIFELCTSFIFIASFISDMNLKLVYLGFFPFNFMNKERNFVSHIPWFLISSFNQRILFALINNCY